MIQNLNRLSFQCFGIIMPETPETVGWARPWQALAVCADSAQVWLTESELWLTCEEGMAVLRLSADGSSFVNFYLDKPVKILPGIYYSITAFRDQAVVRYAAPKAPAPQQDLPRQESLSLSRRLGIDRLYTLFYQEKEPGFLFSGEAHPVTELTYVDQGSLHSVADGQDILLEQGELMLYAPGQWHMQYADIGVAPRFMTVTFDTGDCELSSLYNRKFSPNQRSVGYLQQILREQERMDSLSPDLIMGMLTLVLLQLQRQLDKPANPLQSPHGLSSENDIIRRAQQYITSHVRSRLTVPLVAENTNVSSSYLTALFHKHLQISPGEYIRRIKLQESKQMIREGNMNFTEISQALQYSTIHHFSRQFKEKFGITPSQYAKSIK